MTSRAHALWCCCILDRTYACWGNELPPPDSALMLQATGPSAGDTASGPRI